MVLRGSGFRNAGTILIAGGRSLLFVSQERTPVRSVILRRRGVGRLRFM